MFRRCAAKTLAALLVAAVSMTAPQAGSAQELADSPPPDGWEVRFDREGSSVDDVEFMPMPPGFHVTTGPAMIAYHPDSIARGDFRIESETFLFDPGSRREAFGFFVGGTDLQGPDQSYTYFLIREGGEFLVKTRSGQETEEIQGWTAHESVVSFATKPADASTAKNVLELQADGDQLRFHVNGAEVWSGPRAGLATDGVFGLRVNHGLNVHVTSIATKD